MKLSKPNKEIIFKIEQKALENEEISCFFKQMCVVEKGKLKCIIDNATKTIILSVDDIECIDRVYRQSYSFLEKNVDFKAIFNVEIKVNIEDVDAFEFMSNYFSEPYEDAEFLCFETRFLCNDGECCNMVSIGAESDNEISVSITDTLEENENLQVKYEQFITIANKVIKY